MKKLALVLTLGSLGILMVGCGEIATPSEKTNAMGIPESALETGGNKDMYKESSFSDAQKNPSALMTKDGEKSKAKAFKAIYNEPAANYKSSDYDRGTTNYISFIDEKGDVSRVAVEGKNVIEIVDSKATEPYFIFDGTYFLLHREPYSTYTQPPVDGVVVDKTVQTKE